MILDGANDKIQIVTDAVADIEISRSWVENNAGTLTPSGGPLASVVTATTFEVIAVPGASKQRSVREMKFYNNHATTACTCTIQRTDATNTVNLAKVVLAAGESLVYGSHGIWVYYDSTGKPYMGLGPIATQADQESGSSLTAVVTSGRQHFHPSAVKTWLSAGVTANILSSYNVTSLTDTGTGDVAITIATDFSSANYACASAVQRINSTAAEANSRIGTIKTGSQAAGSISLDCWDGTATTNVIKDPTSWHTVMCGDFA